MNNSIPNKIKLVIQFWAWANMLYIFLQFFFLSKKCIYLRRIFFYAPINILTLKIYNWCLPNFVIVLCIGSKIYWGALNLIYFFYPFYLIKYVRCINHHRESKNIIRTVAPTIQVTLPLLVSGYRGSKFVEFWTMPCPACWINASDMQTEMANFSQ